MLALSEKYVSQVDPIALSTIQCGAAAILCIACMFLFEGGLDLQALSNRKALGAVVYVALGGTCAAYVLQNVAMHHISATFAALAFCTEPVFTALFAYLLLGETLSAQGVRGRRHCAGRRHGGVGMAGGAQPKGVTAPPF